ncbi:CBO0543 family protein [Alkalihalobacillus macyae]|uniref:CBO0543 family protein n=1 Tax=Guptibacillus hwajinpoensis TaxID=208199 RepID=UPI00273C47B6|nr:CBO0543 family protein [Alkalihalobacillus macyae]MDP4552924.1 CBO0543 family protein [Alkalihalobacillus macyae]
MNLILITLLLLVSLRKGDWKNWELYYPTMLYVSLSSFVYEFISHSHFHLWELQEDHLFNLMNVHFVHNLIINPLVAFLYLSNYPRSLFKKFYYTVIWIIMFGLIEWLGKWMEVITYHNDWSIGWSLFFLTIMFPMILLHHTHKLVAIILSFIFATLYLLIFDYI